MVLFPELDAEVVGGFFQAGRDAAAGELNSVGDVLADLLPQTAVLERKNEAGDDLVWFWFHGVDVGG
jgi:hypothetical protein